MDEQWSLSDVFPDPSFCFSVGRRTMDPPGYMQHRHEFMELTIIHGGSGIHVTNGDECPITVGDVFVTPVGHTHGYRMSTQLQYTDVLFLPEWLNSISEHLQILPGYHALFILEPIYRHTNRAQCQLHLDNYELAQVSESIDLIEAECSKLPVGYRTMVPALFLQLIVYLGRRYTGRETPGSISLLHIAEAISIVEQDFCKPHSMKSLAAVAHMSVNQFLRVFRQVKGITPLSYIIQLRIRRACELLHRSELSVTQVAFEVGFSDTSYFTRKFKQVTGLTPTEYSQRANTWTTPR